MRRYFTLVGWVVLAMLAACESAVPPTEVLVSVGSDLQVGAELVRVDVEVYARGGTGLALQSASFPLAVGDGTGYRLPLSFSIVPSSARDTRDFRVVVTGIGSLTEGGEQGPVVEKQLISAFQTQTQVGLEVFLSRVCLGKLCRDSAGLRGDLTCNSAGECASVPVETKPGTDQDGAVPQDDGGDIDAQPGSDGEVRTDADAEAGAPDATGDGGTDPADAQADAMSDADMPPAGDCDTARPCSAGFVCVQAKCESKCTQTQCDPNATCSLIDGMPTCACGSGFIQMTSGAGAVTCVADLSCEQLGCDANAMCVVNADQTRACVCKPGYSGTGKSCAPVDCGAGSLTNGTATAVNGVTTYGGTLNYACSTGYTRSGAASATCGVDGKWSASASCSIVDCGTPSLPNGKATLPGATTYGSTVNYTCNSGYNRVGSATGTCGANKSWSPVPTCSPVTCSPLSIPTKASISYTNGNSYDSVATYSCTVGTLQGNSTRTCQASGGWSGSDPTCLFCGDGMVTGTEQCDPNHSSYNYWNCTPSCTRTTAYNWCVSASDCTGGTVCFTGLGICTQGCSLHSQCPAVTGGVAKPFCPIQADPTGYGICVASQCRTASDCPNFLRCYTGGNTSFCSSCAAGPDCQ